MLDFIVNFSCFKCEIFVDGISFGNVLGLVLSFFIFFGIWVVVVRVWKRGVNFGFRGGNNGYCDCGFIGLFSNGLVINECWKCYVSI